VVGKSMAIAKDEYNTVWLGTAKPNMRQVYRGLSRYYDINHLNDLAEAESGWDHTIRFGRKCLEFLPVDLNPCYTNTKRILLMLPGNLAMKKKPKNGIKPPNTAPKP
jgi:neutral trehalase